MTVAYYISPFDPALWRDGTPSPEPTSSLRLDPTEYRDKLLRRWPFAREWPSESYAAGVYWTLDEEYLLGVEVHLHHDLQHVSFGPYGVNFLDFILWHRAYVPICHRLYLFSISSVMDTLVLGRDTRREQVVAFAGLTGEELMTGSPLNGTWDGSVKMATEVGVVTYRCTLHLFVYASGLQADCLIGGQRLASGAIRAELRGDHPNNLDQFHLLRDNTIHVIGDRLESEIESYDVLRLQYLERDPAKLIGTCINRERRAERELGEIELSRRGLYESPPS